MPITSPQDLTPYFSLDSLGHVLMTYTFDTLKAKGNLRSLVAIDATAGNGHDTLFLAQKLAPKGHVWAFDIQENALECTKKRLANALAPRAPVSYIQACHSLMAQYVTSPVHAILFNLGYLPGSNKHICTDARSSLEAIRQGQNLLAVGGFLWIHSYTGQKGGQEESDAIIAHVEELSYEHWRVLHIMPPNKKIRREHAFFIQKRRASCLPYCALAPI